MQMSRQETQIAALAVVSILTEIASLVHRNWRAGWIDFFRTSVQIQDFSGPEIHSLFFRTF